MMVDLRIVFEIKRLEKNDIYNIHKYLYTQMKVLDNILL